MKWVDWNDLDLMIYYDHCINVNFFLLSFPFFLSIMWLILFLISLLITSSYFYWKSIFANKSLILRQLGERCFWNGWTKAREEQDCRFFWMWNTESWESSGRSYQTVHAKISWSGCSWYVLTFYTFLRLAGSGHLSVRMWLSYQIK